MSAFIQTSKLARGTSGGTVPIDKVGGGTVNLPRNYLASGPSRLAVAVESEGDTVYVQSRVTARRSTRGTVEVETP
jgi:hypothetical protein